jgi:hypothetical protein
MYLKHLLILLQKWALGAMELISCSGKAAQHGVQGLCVGVGGGYRVTERGVIEVAWDEV